MDLLKTAAQLFMNKLGDGGSGLNVESVTSGLQKLLPTNGGDLDLSSLVSMFTNNSGGLAAMASSWLGDGGNKDLDISSVLSLFGDSKVTEFAEGLGLNKEQAASGLSNMIPDLIDKGSEGGSLVGNIGAKLGSDLLGKFF